MQISSSYSMKGVPYENRCRQNDIPQFSTERTEQENESINPYMEDTDFNEKAFDMIGPNAPQEVTLASNNVNNIVNDTSKYDEYKEKVKDLEKELQTRKDTFEKMTEPLVYVCDCYQKFNVVTGMPKSTFGDSFGYAMKKEISDYMQDFYAGKVSSEELDSYFEKCCTSMRTYRTGQHQTSGTNEADNTQIVSEMYEVFAKENAMTPMRH